MTDTSEPVPADATADPQRATADPQHATADSQLSTGDRQPTTADRLPTGNVGWIAVLVGCAALVLTPGTPSLGLVPLGYLPEDSAGRAAQQWMTLAAAAAIAGAVLTRRWWRYQLPLGVLLLMPVPLIGSDSLTAITVQTSLTEIARMVLLFGALGAAQSLIRRGRAGQGAAVAGAAIGCWLVGTAAGWAGRASADDALWLTLASIGLIAAGGAARLLPGDRPLPTSAATDNDLPDGQRMRLRVTIAGLLAAATALLPLAWLHGLAPRLVGLSGDQVHRHPAVPFVVAGVVGVVAALTALAVVGPVPSAGTLIAALAAIGSAGLLLALVTATVALHPAAGWPAVLVGVAVGVAAAGSRERVSFAAVGALVCALFLWAAWPVQFAAGDSYFAPNLLRATPDLAAAVGLVALTATVVALTGAAAAGVAGVGGLGLVLGGDRITGASDSDQSVDSAATLDGVTALPVVFGPVFVALVDSARSVLANWQLLGEPRVGTLPAVSPNSDGVLLVVAGAAVVVVTVLGARLLRVRRAATNRVPPSYLPY